jgi:P27 family predicted phage terminase small subunit
MAKRKLAPKTAENPTPIVECPAEISDGGRKIWDRLAPPLIAEGRLTELDCTTFAILCSAIADWFSAQEALQTYGPVIKSPSGYPVQSPYVSVAAKHLETIIRLSVEFGLTPASRKRVPSGSSSWMDDYPILDDCGIKPLVLEPPDKK